MRDKLDKIGIPCPDIQWPINRNEWGKFFNWQIPLAETMDLEQAKTIMEVHGYTEISPEKTFNSRYYKEPNLPSY